MEENLVETVEIPLARKKRVKLTPVDRERLVKSVLEHGMTSEEVAVSSGVSPGTVRNLVSRFNRGEGFATRRELFPTNPNLPKRGRRRILTEEELGMLLEFVDPRPWETLAGCQHYIRQYAEKNISVEGIRKILRREGYKVKEIHHVPVGRNTEAAKESRFQYAVNMSTRLQQDLISTQEGEMVGQELVSGR